ncbi:uncharacterized protein PRCAT00004168001 [Priceomyces carsonii]|uniref:uncharacterized protein n=1 Tax=Priceomyces carsonii TaxID=28549 RepID=UPI002EDA64C7|nr:unnamed protein product [Priceomyces carsonii]
MAVPVIIKIALFSQSIFVGGNVIISGVFIPSILQNYHSDTAQAKQWVKLYDDCSKIMGFSALVSFGIYFYEVLFDNVTREFRNACMISGIASIAVIPFTALFILPTVKKLKEIAKINNVEEIKTTGLQSHISTWNKLSIARAAIFTVGFVNSLANFV